MKKTLLIDEKDSVIIALTPIKEGEVVEGITVLDDIPMGHKIARTDIAKGDLVIKYGHIIGRASVDIKKGNHIHSHNLVTHLEETESYKYQKKVIEKGQKSDLTFEGYIREDGRVGIRNDLYIIPLVGCVNAIVKMAQDELKNRHPEMSDSIKVLSHPYGCSQLGDDLQTTKLVLQGLAHNPNAGATMIVGLGCENNRLSEFMKDFAPIPSDRFSSFNLQEVEDEYEHLVSEGERLIANLKKDVRKEVPLSKLTVGLKCGGSDGFSGLTANPLVGRVCDIVGANGGKVALTEVPEMFGAEQLLMDRAEDEKTFTKVVDLINNFKNYYAKNGQPCYENPSPGNKDGGITTLEEKSLGCVLKGGSLEVEDVLDIGEPITHDGLTLVNGPGNDLVASTNLAAAGCSLLIFTTGRGTPFGSVIPTIKVATNHILAERKKNWIDFDAGSVFENGFDVEAQNMLKLIIDTCSGKKTKSEENGACDIAIFKTGVTL